MADDEKTDKKAQAEDGQAEPTAESVASEETPTPAADESATPAAPTKPPEKAAAVSAPLTDAGDDAEPIGPKERRRLERSRADGPAAPPRSKSERATARDERRRLAAASRKRSRARAKEKAKASGENRQGTPPAEHPRSGGKVRVGKVVSDRSDKTITVQIERARRHPRYEKIVRRSNTLHAHDERNDAKEGDVVRVIETRPLSRTKRWRLVEVVERAR